MFSQILHSLRFPVRRKDHLDPTASQSVDSNDMTDIMVVRPELDRIRLGN